MYRFEGGGDESGDGTCGDLLVNLIVKEHATHKIDNILSRFDLNTTVSVPFFDYLYGGEYRLRHLDGADIVVQYPAQSAQRVIVLEGKGLSSSSSSSERGALYVFFDVHMPVVPTEKLSNPVVRLMLRRLFRSPVP
ncbi:DnaJ subfamily A member 2 [Tetrabaena socialis]|uniref:DnaJ subfamily A member 2 n=1 Tax=Tetrabaena socialis TaxID=47790 RepID=A0A2J7ZLW3_9CHLO|nr:DnaJ subfamily A member 2 [Tetrabaena socialis]|eukprot:PNH01240.1 DnaJ subfamily A member 2 [Tetrabaena socialis]